MDSLETYRSILQWQFILVIRCWCNLVAYFYWYLCHLHTVNAVKIQNFYDQFSRFPSMKEKDKHIPWFLRETLSWRTSYGWTDPVSYFNCWQKHFVWLFPWNWITIVIKTPVVKYVIIITRYWCPAETKDNRKLSKGQSCPFGLMSHG